MPWVVEKSSKCPSYKPWAVINQQNGAREGCHPSKDAATQQQKALYAKEPRFNQNHDKEGKFTFGQGGSGAAITITDNVQGREFIRSNFDGWHKSLNSSEDKALSFWQSPGFELMNGQLRGNPVGASTVDLKRATQASKDLVGAIRRSPPLSSPVIVHRGFSAFQFDLKPGARISDKGFVSVSLTSTGVTAISQHGSPAVARILLPKGMRVGAGYTRELILPPGTSFRVLAVNRKGRTTKVDLEAIP